MTLIRFVMMNSLLECGLQSIRQDGAASVFQIAVRKQNHLTIQDGEVGSCFGVLMTAQSMHLAFAPTSALAFIAASKVGIDFFVRTV